jgi:hypothetical protein
MFSERTLGSANFQYSDGNHWAITEPQTQKNHATLQQKHYPITQPCNKNIAQSRMATHCVITQPSRKSIALFFSLHNFSNEFGSFFQRQDTPNELKGYQSSHLCPSSTTKWMQSTMELCQDGYEFCWMACLALDPQCQDYEQVCFFTHYQCCCCCKVVTG